MRLRLLAVLTAIFLCFSAFAEKVNLGKLGQALQDVAIYARPKARARVFYHVKAYEYLVLRESNYEGYYRVVMQNGSFGYVPEADVALLPYNVTADQGDPSSREELSLASRGAGTARGLATSAGRAEAANLSTAFVGKTRYKWGGNDPNTGIDCSGFVKFLYGEIGIRLPRTAAQQAMVGKPVTRLQDLQSGDRLYFWDFKRNMIGHTGIYLGNGYFCHSSSGHKGVATDYLGQKKWQAILVAARR